MKSFEAKNVRKNFGGVEALKNADFRMEGAQISGLVGANGSGKTTFARICAGLVRADNAEIYIDGKSALINTPLDAKKFGIVLVHQNLSLIPDLSVWENINLSNEKRSKGIFLDNRYAKELARKVLADLGLEDIPIDTKVADIGPGEKQIVEIAKALSKEPKLLILDEPTAPLEYHQVEKLFKKVRELKEHGVSVIFISHRLWEITKLCDIVHMFRNGETVGTIDFSKQPRDENLIVPFVAGPGGDTNYIKKEKRDFSKVETVLELKNISFLKKVSDIDLDLRKGEIIGLGGLSGQGQQELLMVIAGVLKPTKGKIYLDGKEVTLRHPMNAIRNEIFMIPGDRQKDGLFIDHSIFNNIVYPRYSQKKERFMLDFKSLNQETDLIINKMSVVPPISSLPVGKLSGGNQQKVVFGRWLQFNSKILLLNDPAKGIDVQAKSDLYRLVNDISHDGTSVILYASSNEELINNCDRVLIMFEGKIVEDICHEEICDEKLLKSSLRVR
jgi:ribose transport system ATP-binding protein